jgi:hypothetical protein
MRFPWLLLAAAPAFADVPLDTPTATEVDRDTTPPGGGELGFDAGSPLDTWAASLETSYVDRPIALGSAVRRRETVVLGGALALGPSVVVDGRFPLSHQIGERLREGDFDSTARLDRFVPGDLRFGVRLHVAHPVFLRGELALPTGDAHDFAGESSWMASWGLIGRFEPADGVVIAGGAGVRLRGDEVLIGDRVVGDELFGAAGAIVHVAPALALGGDIAAVLGDKVLGVKGPYPAEVHAGVVGNPLPNVELSVRAGIGLDDEIGAPRFRVTLQLVYRGTMKLIEPEPPPPETELAYLTGTSRLTSAP